MLLDPDSLPRRRLIQVATAAQQDGAVAILVGGSFLCKDDFGSVVRALKRAVNLPVVLFPGNSGQLSRYADGILFTSLLSGRNPQYLIGEQVMAAPIIRRMGLEAIPTAYLLIESGRTTSTEFVSDTRPIPRDKPQLVAAHAQAAELFGMKAVYLEAGSGAEQPVPPDVVRAVRKSVSISLIVGGGIASPEAAVTATEAGADVVVVGTAVERGGREIIHRIASAIKGGRK